MPRRTKSPRTPARPLRTEPLEERRLLAATHVGDIFPDWRDGFRPESRPAHFALPSPRDEDHGAGLHQRHVIDGETYEFAAIESLPVVPAVQEVGQALTPISDIPLLNSLPGAAATLYLDFNGHFEATWGVYSNITTPVYDADGDASTFSESELAFIHGVWADVAEDFAPFNINVTTIEPPELAPGAPASAADGVAMRIAIGGDSSWLGSNYGGFAYIGAFTNYIPNVAYVFSGGRTDSMSQATVVAHEAGHAFGLYHHVNNHFDAQARQSAIMWGMGFGYEHTYWHREIVEDGTLQDDMAIIAGPVNGFGYRADDHGNSLGSATPLGADLTASGIISTTTDRDVFAVPAGSFHFTLEGHSPGQNLDAVLELLDSSGNVLLTADPGDSLDASLIGGGVGTTYIAVRSTGQYGRVGQYTLTATPSTPGVTVNTSGPALTTSELGRSETITLSLNARPTADVTFSVDVSDTSEASLSASQVTFTPDNWFVPQSVVVTGKGDSVEDGAAGYTLTLSPASSSDPAYDGLDPADLSLVNLDDVAGRLYWMTYHGSSELATIETSTLAGDNVQTLLDVYTAYGAPNTSYYHPENLAIDSLRGKLYWSDATNDNILSANLDGSDPQVVIAGIERPYGLAVDTVAGKLYWIEVSLRQIRRANLDGSQIETVVSEGVGTSGELAIDSAAGKIYWENPSTRTISRANLDGTDAEVIVSGDGTQQHRAFAIDPAAGKIYFNRRTSFSSNLFYRANLDGTGEELLLDISPLYPTVDGTVESMTVDAASGRFYWTTYGGRLFSADLDGSHLALVSELGVSGRLKGLGIMPARPGVTVTPRSGLVTSEAGDTANFSVVLDSKPSADVTIPVTSSDPTEGTVSVSSLVFTPENWNVPQSVTINPVDELVNDGDVAFAIDFGPVASADPNYDGRSIASLAVTNLDNDAPLFADSFEVGEWNGKWVEDSQNDWFRSTQRSTEGSRSAEVDGSASDASLTMAQGVDLTPFATVEVSFDWYIESTLDRNEYLAVDIFNGTWREVARLRGNVDQENTWHHETIEISGSDLVSDFKIRFRGRMNSSNEDANVDNVKIIGTSLAGPPNQLPTAVAGGPYATVEGGSVTLSAAGSLDPDGSIVGYQWDLDGDGQYDDASGFAPTVSFASSGVQSVGLQVTDDRGGTATASTTVAITNVAPTAALSGPTSTSEGTTITLSAAGSTDPGDDIVSVTWDLDGDGQYDDASGTTVPFTPLDNGTYTVGVRVADDNGAFDTASLQVTAGNVAPTASLPSSFSAAPGEPLTFSSSATDPGADTLTYEWDFSYNGSFTVDAAGVNLASPSHTFASDGTYTVALRVRDDDGGLSAVRTAEVNVSSAPTDLLYFSMASNATVGGVSAANEDILALEADGSVRMIFDGSDVGLSSRTIAGFSITGPNEILLAFTSSTSLPGLGTVDDSDIVKFTASSLGSNTAGSFSMYFDGSDVGLTTSNERLSAFHSLPDGRLIVSTTGTAYVPGASAARQDLLLFTPSSLGSSTSGSWSLLFDGSDVGLSSSSENIDAVSVDAQGRLYLSTTGNFSVPGRSGTNEDVFVFTASSLGSNTSGSFSSTLYLDGSALGLGGNDIRGVTLPESVPTIGAIVSPRPAKRGSFDQPAESSPQVEQAARAARSARLLDLAFGWEEDSASATSADESSLARKSINHRSSAAPSLFDAALAAAFEDL